MTPWTHNICQLQKQDTNSEYVQKLSETGTQRDSSNLSEPQLGSDFTMSSPSYPELLETMDIVSSTQGSPVLNRSQTWNAKSNICLENSPDIKLYETSVRELIGEDPDLRPFFDTAWRDQYEKSWLPTETDSLVSGSSSSSLLLKKQEENSWFSVNLRTNQQSSNQNANSGKICFPSSTSSPPDIMEEENIEETTEEPPKRKRVRKSKKLAKEGKVLRSRRVRILPNRSQREILRNCMGVYRYIYNECVRSEKNGLIHGASSAESSRWRTILTKKSNYYNLGQSWKDICPCHTKQQAVEEFFKAKKTGMKMVAQGELQSFDIKFKSRFKMIQETIPFEWHSFKKDEEAKYSLAVKYNGADVVFKIKGKVPKNFRDRNDPKYQRSEIKITRTRLGKYYANIPYEVNQSRKFQGDMSDMVSFDPGCKTFQTFHSPDGTWGEIGNFDKQEELLKKSDDIRSRLDTLGKSKTSRWRRRMKRKFLGINQKVKNRTADLHNKVCSWVVNSYKVILLPVFKTQSMVSSRRLVSSTCRKMMTWSHYTFQRKLVSLAQKFTDVKVRLCNEAFTTKQCGRCGIVNDNMTLGDRVFWCDACGLRSSRDGHAARNVGLRSLRYIVDT